MNSLSELVALRSSIAKDMLSYREAILAKSKRLWSEGHPVGSDLIRALEKELETTRKQETSLFEYPVPVLLDLDQLARAPRQSSPILHRWIVDQTEHFRSGNLLREWIAHNLTTPNCHLIVFKTKSNLFATDQIEGEPLTSVLASHLETFSLQDWKCRVTAVPETLPFGGEHLTLDLPERLIRAFFGRTVNLRDRNRQFSGRKAELGVLNEHLSRYGISAITQALVGIGGVGKTELALEFCHRNQHRYDSVFWVRADDLANIREDFIAIYDSLKLTTRDRVYSYLSKREKDEIDENPEVRAVLSWMASNKDWLLVLDNVEKPELLPRFLPQKGGGHVIVTSRRRDLPVGGHAPTAMTLHEWPPDTAVAFLWDQLPERWRQQNPRDREYAVRLSELLGGLPVLVAGAGRYIKEKSLSCRQYFGLFEKRGLEMFTHKDSTPHDYNQSATVVWRETMAAIDEQSVGDSRFTYSADLMRIMAFLNPDSIAISFFESSLSVLDEASRDKGNHVLGEVLDPLQVFALISKNEKSEMFTTHRMIQRVIRDSMKAAERRRIATLVIKAIDSQSGLLNVSFGNFGRQLKVIGHAYFLAGLLMDPQTSKDFEFEEAAALLTSAGFVFSNIGRTTEAEPLFDKARAIRGEEETEALGKTLWWQADNYDRQGKHQQARPLFLRALAILQKKQGPKSSDVGQIMNSLGINHMDDHLWDDAETWFGKARDAWAHSGNNSNIGAFHFNLGMLRERQGREADAEENYRKSVTMLEKSSLPYMIRWASQHLASFLVHRGKDKEALSFFRIARKAAEQELHETLAQLPQGKRPTGDAKREVERVRSLVHSLLLGGAHALGRASNAEESAEWRKAAELLLKEDDLSSLTEDE
jgi:tetratricopeptide (TPR) repeat protein